MKNLENLSDKSLEFDIVSVSNGMLFGALENREHKFTPDSFNLHNQHLHSRSHLETLAVFQASYFCTDGLFLQMSLAYRCKMGFISLFELKYLFFPHSKIVIIVTTEKKLIFSSEFSCVFVTASHVLN